MVFPGHPRGRPDDRNTAILRYHFQRTTLDVPSDRPTHTPVIWNPVDR
jgi:hypothetical protein